MAKKKRKKYHLFTPEQEKDLINWYPGKSKYQGAIEVTERFNKKYKTDLSVAKISSKYRSLANKSLLKSYRKKKKKGVLTLKIIIELNGEEVGTIVKEV